MVAFSSRRIVVLFNACDSHRVTSASQSVSRNNSPPRRRHKLSVIALAVTMASPLAGYGPRDIGGAAHTQDTHVIRAFQTPAAADQLRQAEDQLANNQYEEALATLQQINAQSLNDAQRNAMTQLMTQAQSGAEQRRAARTEFEAGQAALAANNPAEATAHFEAAANNRYADEGTRSKAAEQLAVARDMQSHERPPMSKADVKKIYQQAKKEYNSGDWIAARKHFETARDYGYKPGLFEGDPPAKY